MSRVVMLTQDAQCSALRKDRYACDEQGKRYRCKRAATFAVDNMPLCKVHAGQMALAILAQEREGEQ